MKGDKIKAVIFDIGGVLWIGGKTRFNRREVHTSGVHQIISEKLKISLDQYFDSIDSYYAKSMEGQINKKTLLKVLSLHLNLPPEKVEKLFVETYKKKFKRNNELFKIVEKIKKKGYKTAILSDQWHLSKEVVLSKKDENYFDEIVVSCDVGIRKPNPEIYELILKKLKLKPEEVLFIDNQTWNIIPANKMGMNTILFHSNKQTLRELEKFGIRI